MFKIKVKESHKHKIAKEMLLDWIVNNGVCLKDQNGFYYYPFYTKGFLEYKIYGDEFRNKVDFMFDIGFYDYAEGDIKFAIEIFHKNKVNEKKIDYCKRNNINLFEVNVDNVLNLTRTPKYVLCRALYSDETYKIILDLYSVREFFKFINQLRILNENKQKINSDYLKENFPEVDKFIQRYKGELIILYDLAINALFKRYAWLLDELDKIENKN